MPQAAFEYGSAGESVRATGALSLALTLSVFADRPHVMARLRDDAATAGLAIADAGGLATLLEGPARPLGDVVLVDCPAASGAALAALARLDTRAAHSGAQVIVLTTTTALDDVFGCLDGSHPQILVEPTAAERLVAFGEALARAPRGRVRELSDEDRLAVLRLTEQVGQIARRLDRLTPPGESVAGDNLVQLDAQRDGVRAASAAFRVEPARHLEAVRGAALPDAKLVRRIIRQRQLRARFFDPELFADPAWDMLLDLTAAAAERVRVSVSSLCIAAGVPATTALRWIRQMTDAGLLARIEDQQDRRRAFITLTDSSRAAMTTYFDQIGEGATLAA